MCTYLTDCVGCITSIAVRPSRSCRNRLSSHDTTVGEELAVRFATTGLLECGVIGGGILDRLPALGMAGVSHSDLQ